MIKLSLGKQERVTTISHLENVQQMNKGTAAAAVAAEAELL